MKAFKAFIKPSEAPQRSAKIKIEVVFFSSTGIGTGRVKINHGFVPPIMEDLSVFRKNAHNIWKFQKYRMSQGK